jgi:4-hydroxy-tetrahydrodipicolinate reductase
MIRTVLCGAAGRMGQEIIRFAKDLDDIRVIAGVEAAKSNFVNKTISDVRIYDDLLTVIDKADCIVEFTNHQATIEHLKKSRKYKKPYVIGTTGFDEAGIATIRDLGREFPILLSANMSLGINHLYDLVRSTLDRLPGYDIEIIETHHRLKKDAPSGTARMFAQIVREKRRDAEFVHGREGMTGERRDREVGVHAVRGGDVVGEHRVRFFGAGEFIELVHFATSRQCLVYGTVEAIRFIINQPPGVYSMEDLFKARKS